MEISNLIWFGLYLCMVGHSPKRSRRDGKPAPERVPSRNNSLDSRNQMDQDQKSGRREKDGGLPLETPLATDSKLERGAPSNEPDRKSSGRHEGTQHSSNPSEASRSRSYFQVLFVFLYN